MPEYNKEGLRNVLFVAISVCLVCSVVVSAAAVVLKPMQKVNQALDQKQNILRAAGMLPAGRNVDAEGRGVDELFAQFQARVVDLTTGQYLDDVDPAGLDPLRVAKDPARSIRLDGSQDIATLRRRENVSVVYVREAPDGTLDKLVIPIRGYGLWGTLYGYLAIEGDLETVAGLGFYSHKETPGLGGEVDNPNWKAQWPGVRLLDASGAPSIQLVKTRSPEGSDNAAHEVDALSGATLTTKGVENLVRFWTGELGFGPFLNHLKSTG